MTEDNEKKPRKQIQRKSKTNSAKNKRTSQISLKSKKRNNKIESKCEEKSRKKVDKNKQDTKNVDKTSKEYYRTYYKAIREQGIEMKDYNKYKLAFPALITNKKTIEYIKDQRIEKINEYIFNIVKKPISCMGSTEKYVYIGTKQDTQPFNVFEVKNNETYIEIFDINLNYVNTCVFLHGDVFQIECANEYVYILFADGTFIRIKEVELIVNTKIDENSYENIALKSHKIIAFAIEDDLFVATNGFTIITKDQSIAMKSMVIQLVLNKKVIYCLDVQSKVFQMQMNLEGVTEVFSDFKILKIKPVYDYLIAVLDTGEFYLLNVEPSERKNVCFLGFFFHLENGVITYFKIYKDNKKRVNLYQISDCNEKTILTNPNAQIKTAMFIPCIIDKLRFVLIALESGVIFKLYYI